MHHKIDFNFNNQEAFSVYVPDTAVISSDIANDLVQMLNDKALKYVKSLGPEFQRIVDTLYGACECGADKAHTTHSSWCPKA